ncbi:hypothetical protein [Bartonella refiksaydamii]|uniref:hypothetical protein n=1 Tax=Bartonella refiksaydamii TaxID=2654951 RepID=UPI0012EC51C1|nr:hypothetical protein [Bartonella refiksaydamii]
MRSLRGAVHCERRDSSKEQRKAKACGVVALHSLNNIAVDVFEGRRAKLKKMMKMPMGCASTSRMVTIS